MSDTPLTAKDYPLAEKWPGRVKGGRDKSLDDMTIEAVVSGDMTMDDLQITPEALMQQAEIARSVGRGALADNFERAAEMTRVPNDLIMDTYELLRPGRAKSQQELLDRAEQLRREFNAARLADYVEEAAGHYEKRGLFRARF